MADLEKVIYSIERCISHVPDACRDCMNVEHPYPTCQDILLNEAMELLKARSWISVKERLPEDGQVVLGFLCDNGYQVLTFSVAKNRWWGNEVWYWFEEISHWMPLPEPPKEE